MKFKYYKHFRYWTETERTFIATTEGTVLYSAGCELTDFEITLWCNAYLRWASSVNLSVKKYESFINSRGF